MSKTLTELIPWTVFKGGPILLRFGHLAEIYDGEVALISIAFKTKWVELAGISGGDNVPVGLLFSVTDRSIHCANGFRDKLTKVHLPQFMSKEWHPLSANCMSRYDFEMTLKRKTLQGDPLCKRNKTTASQQHTISTLT